MIGKTLFFNIAKFGQGLCMVLCIHILLKTQTWSD